ncbi:EKC/KEOPS complex subunit PCC1 [Lachancea thermotolerans]|uniref:KLTH0E00990p n=1 Tax=Lachancea thermotolerans (strain ATCC 56472 / CBS 6340 / NRRL Y-8284) TaxID=559295 RepID=C5DH33_LACTC|nr:KLTH0E00990p [Lachancea thermotolerans CBS 6340]CAR23094.1 KLTH0E00990p [Lachancea thermotolerans CBS 6340]
MKGTRQSDLAYTLYLEVPFKTAKQAETAVKVLKPDPILKPQDFHVEYSSKAHNLCVSFEGVDDRVLRVGVSSVIESIKTIIETIDEFSH